MDLLPGRELLAQEENVLVPDEQTGFFLALCSLFKNSKEGYVYLDDPHNFGFAFKNGS